MEDLNLEVANEFPTHVETPPKTEDSILREKLSIVALQGIAIKPGMNKAPVLNLRQSFLFPRIPGLTPGKVCDSCTQTSRAQTPQISYNCDPAPVQAVTVKPRAKTPSFKCKSSRPSSKIKRLKPEMCLQSGDHKSGLEDIVGGLMSQPWERVLHALKCLISVSHLTSWVDHEDLLTAIHRRLIELVKSPRSVIVRFVCQAFGELFKTARTFKRPIFDEIVALLLQKTADSNRFIQRDSNIALDKMVTFLPVFHSARALALHGQNHKSSMARASTARLFVCLSALAGLDTVVGNEANERTRRRVLGALESFLEDKSADVRRFGERLYQVLKGHALFEPHFFKDMDVPRKIQFKKLFISLDG